MYGRYIILIAVLTLVFSTGIFFGKEVLAGGGTEPGTEGDPLVAKSYVHQEVETRSDILKARITELEEKVEELQSRIDQLQ